MPNYKPYGYETFEIQGYTRRLPNDTTLKILYYEHNNNAAPFSLFESGAVYTVTTGKKFKIIGIYTITNGLNSAHVKLYQGDTQDAITTLKQYFGHPAQSTREEFLSFEEISAGKYVTIDPASTHLEFSFIIGYEVTA